MIQVTSNIVMLALEVQEKWAMNLQQNTHSSINSWFMECNIHLFFDRRYLEYTAWQWLKPFGLCLGVLPYPYRAEEGLDDDQFAIPSVTFLWDLEKMELMERYL